MSTDENPKEIILKEDPNKKEIKMLWGQEAQISCYIGFDGKNIHVKAPDTNYTRFLYVFKAHQELMALEKQAISKAAGFSRDEYVQIKKAARILENMQGAAWARIMRELEDNAKQKVKEQEASANEELK